MVNDLRDKITYHIIESIRLNIDVQGEKQMVHDAKFRGFCSINRMIAPQSNITQTLTTSQLREDILYIEIIKQRLSKRLERYQRDKILKDRGE